MLTVWLDAWQMQCCGTPFRVGDDVSWTLRPMVDIAFATTVLGPAGAAAVTHAEDHHGDLPEGLEPTTGVVRSIRAVACRFGPSPEARTGVLSPVAGSGHLSYRKSADGWERESDERRFVAYLVELAD